MSQLGQPNSFYRPEDAGARNRNERLVLIVNPRAGGGRGVNLEALSSAADHAFVDWTVSPTEGPGHATQLAREAVEGGAQVVVAVGGDGTCHEVVQGLFDGPRVRSRKVAFSTIPAGSGCDLARSLHMPRSAARALWVAATGITLPTDVGLLRRGHETQVFINSAGVGTNGDVVRRANASTKPLGGRATYLLAALQSSLHYGPQELDLHWEGGEGSGEWAGKAQACFITNGAWCGGGMHLGRGGSMQDGLLDLSIIPELSPTAWLRHLPRLYDGRIDRVPGAVRVRMERLSVRGRLGADLPLELDGENGGQPPAHIEVLKGVLPVRAAWPTAALRR